MPGRPTCMTLKLPEDLKSFIEEKQTEFTTKESEKIEDDTIEDKMVDNEEDEDNEDKEDEEDEEEMSSEEEEEIKIEVKPAKKKKSNPVTKKKINNTKNGLFFDFFS